MPEIRPSDRCLRDGSEAMVHLRAHEGLVKGDEGGPRGATTSHHCLPREAVAEGRRGAAEGRGSPDLSCPPSVEESAALTPRVLMDARGS